MLLPVKRRQLSNDCWNGEKDGVSRDLRCLLWLDRLSNILLQLKKKERTCIGRAKSERSQGKVWHQFRLESKFGVRERVRQSHMWTVRSTDQTKMMLHSEVFVTRRSTLPSHPTQPRAALFHTSITMPPSASPTSLLPLAPDITGSYTPVTFGRGNLLLRRKGKERNILVVSLHRPKVANAFSDDMYLDLIDVLHLSAKDSSVAAIVLTGSGPFFSSGADLTGLNQSFEEAQNSVGGRQTLHKPAGRFMMAIIAFPKVIAAAVQGPAVGIGVTLLLHCDLVHLSKKATLWVPFTRLALVPELCSSKTFLQSMGLSKANELLLLGRKIDAPTAVEWNIASRVVDNHENFVDPFHPKSMASQMAQELDRRLLSLPEGSQTSEYFVALMKGERRLEMERVCSEEVSTTMIGKVELVKHFRLCVHFPIDLTHSFSLLLLMVLVACETRRTI